MKSWPNMKLCQGIIRSYLVLSTRIYPQIQFWSIYSLNYIHLPLFTYIWHKCAILWMGILCIETTHLCKILEQSDNYSWRYCVSRIEGYRKCCHECSLGDYLVIDNFVCTFWCFTPVSSFKAIGQLGMGILHFEDFGDTECRHECSCSSARSVKFNGNVPRITSNTNKNVQVESYPIMSCWSNCQQLFTPPTSGKDHPIVWPKQ